MTLIFDLWLEVRRLYEIQLQISKKIDIQLLSVDHDLLEDQIGRSAAESLLRRYTGISSRKRLHILMEANSHFESRYTISYEGKKDEFTRIVMLGEIVTYSEKYVLAYTYASPEYLKIFWGNHEHHAIDDYFGAHERAIKAKRDLRRVFVVPDDLHLKDPYAYSLLMDVITKLIMLKMKYIYVLTSTVAEEAFVDQGRLFPTRSFLVADNCFVSEGEGSVTADERQSSYCLFTSRPDDCKPYVDAFDVLESKSGHPLRKNELNDLLKLRRETHNRK
jgi:hypothetical protein